MNYTNHIRISSIRSINLFAALVHSFEKISTTIGVWKNRSNERYQLKSLDNHLLEDMGITRSDALAEARKPFWVA